jgi:drug/metabolite transporter (DMT)-like permease
MLIWVLFAGNLAGILSIWPREWFIFILIGLTTGSGAIFLYYYGLTRIRAMLATMCELCFPMSAILFDYIFNHKILSPVQWISAMVMVLAILKLSINKPEN